VTVVATATNTLVAEMSAGVEPYRVAITPDGAFAYVTNIGGSVSIIATATNTVVASLPAAIVPLGLGITPDGALVYVADAFTNSVAVISNATHVVVASIPVGSQPRGVALTPRPPVLPLEVDIKPGSGLAPINATSNGRIPVALLSSAQLNVPADVDLTTLRFGHTGTEPSLAFCGGPIDVNGDGLPDIICHFRAADAGFQAGDTEGILTGRTRAGAALEGRDGIRIVRF
jgi:YVTN family beta-propeller protein